MVKVDGRQSEAVVLSVETEVDGNVGMLFIDIEAPMNEMEQWKDHQQVHLEAAWKPPGSRTVFASPFIPH